MKNKNIYRILSLLTIVTISLSSYANYNVEQLMKDPKNWAIWDGNYAAKIKGAALGCRKATFKLF